MDKAKALKGTLKKIGGKLKGAAGKLKDKFKSAKDKVKKKLKERENKKIKKEKRKRTYLSRAGNIARKSSDGVSGPNVVTRRFPGCSHPTP